MKRSKKGFTLVEMLVVIAIIAVLVSITVPNVMGATTRAKGAADAANLRTELSSFMIEYLSGGTAADTYGYKISDENAMGKSQQTWYKTGAQTSKVDGWTIICITINGTSTDASYVSSTDKGATSHNIAYFADIASTGTIPDN